MSDKECERKTKILAEIDMDIITWSQAGNARDPLRDRPPVLSQLRALVQAEKWLDIAGSPVMDAARAFWPAGLSELVCEAVCEAVGEALPPNPSVDDIVTNYLARAEYGGLYSQKHGLACCCKAGNLFVCGWGPRKCHAGYLDNCGGCDGGPDCAPAEGDFCIVEKRPVDGKETP